jgi:hypothetical protein
VDIVIQPLNEFLESIYCPCGQKMHIEHHYHFDNRYVLGKSPYRARDFMEWGPRDQGQGMGRIRSQPGKLLKVRKANQYFLRPLLVMH